MRGIIENRQYIHISTPSTLTSLTAHELETTVLFSFLHFVSKHVEVAASLSLERLHMTFSDPLLHESLHPNRGGASHRLETSRPYLQLLLALHASLATSQVHGE